MRWPFRLLLPVLAFVWTTGAAALDIRFDYTYDTLGFFDVPERKAVLEAAGLAWEQQLAGAQTPAIPRGTGGNTWTLSFNRPDKNASLDSSNTNIVNKPLPANTVVIYVGARPNVYGGYLGYAEFRYSASGYPSWVNLIKARNSGSRFASFGGAIAFDSDARWYFDPDPGTKEDHPDQTDFHTLAMHEIAHLLGFTQGAAAFQRLSLGGSFHGPRTVAMNGGAPALGVAAHWPEGFRFDGQIMVMAPHLAANERSSISPLETAVLQDLGYAPKTGVRVHIEPAGAVAAGAKWRLNGGGAQASGKAVTGLAPGDYELSFKTPGAYFPPETQTVAVPHTGIAEITVHFVPVPPPTLLSSPSSILAAAGGTAALQVEAEAAGAPLKYRWRKSGTVLTKQTGPRIDLPALKLSDGGTYDVVVSSGGGAAPRQAAHLGVVGPVTGPDVINEGKPLKLKQSATGPALSYQWFKDGQALQDDPNAGISGTTRNQLQIRSVVRAHQGDYHCQVRMPDAAGGDDLELDGSVKAVAVRLRPVVNQVELGPWRVSGTVADVVTAQNDATRFEVRGLPAGVSCDRRTGQLIGKPRKAGLYRLVVTAANEAGNSSPKEFWVDCAALEPGLQGDFSGLASRGHLNKELGGLLALRVSSTGSFSGRLSLANKSHPVRGTVETLPGLNATASAQVKRGGSQAPLQVDLQFEAASGHLTGWVRDGITTPIALEAWQSQWHGKNHPADAFAGDLAVALLPAPHTEPSEDEAQPPLPEGIGYATAKVSRNGVVTWSGRLADGSVHTQSVTLSSGGRLPLHRQLYNGGGSVQGWALLTPQGGVATALELDGELDWRKWRAASKRDRVYPDGFANRLTACGGTRHRREAAAAQLDLTPAAEANALLAFHGANLETSELGDLATVEVGISASNAVSLPPADENPALTRLSSLSTASNLFKGTFTLRDEDADSGATVTRRVSFQGLLVPRLRQGVGWFLLPQLDGSAPARQLTGQVLLEGLP